MSLQLEVWRGEAKREKEARSTLQAELRDRGGRLGSLEDELKRLSMVNEDLSRQLDVAMAFSRSGAVAPKPGTPAATLESATSQPSALNCSRCEAFKARIHELETTGVHNSADKGRLESKYKAYRSDVGIYACKVYLCMAGPISLTEYLGFIDGAPGEQPSDGGRLCQRKEGGTSEVAG